jgi:integrase
MKSNALMKSKLVHKEYTGTSEKIRKFLSYNHTESARNQYYLRLTNLDDFINSRYHEGVDEVLEKIESKKFFIKNNGIKTGVDQYDLIGTYLQYLTNKRKRDGAKLAPSTIHDHTTTAKTFVETETEIVFKTMKYSLKVKPPKIIKGSKIPLPRETILKLINGCTQANQVRLKMILLLLSSCCSRIGESLLLRLSDLHLDGLPHFGTEPPFYPYIYFRGEITKTGKSRTTLLTKEMAEQLQLWIKGKYAVRNRVVGTNDGKFKTVNYAPEMNPNDFAFMNIDSEYTEKDGNLFVYNNLLQLFHKLLHDLKLNQKTSNGQYAITPHKIRMGVRTAISSLVTDKEFPDFYMSHDVSTYYNPSPEQYKAQFKLCQTALTYLDQTAIIKHHEELKERMDSIEEKEITPLNKRLVHMEKELTSMRDMITNKKYLKAFLKGSLEASQEAEDMSKKAYENAKKINDVESMKKIEKIMTFIKNKMDNLPQVVD